jgi:hypothetical protein
MPLELPVLDDRNYEELLSEVKQRIPAYTPEWTNYNVESDPGITLVQLFAFLTDSLLYRANRIPERNRLKFLQLLGIRLQPPAAADGLVVIRNERGPLEALNLGSGVVLQAGHISFLTRDDLTVLPLEGQVYYKKEINESDERYQSLKDEYDAALQALQAAQEEQSLTGSVDTTLKPVFYETASMTKPTAGDPYPVLDLKADALGEMLYIALLAPKKVSPDDVREAIAYKTISIGVVPALTNSVDPLTPPLPAGERTISPSLIFELPDIAASTSEAHYRRLQQIKAPDVLKETGIVQLVLPDASRIQTWTFGEPLDEGRGDYPPRIEDDAIRQRLVSWIRVRLPDSQEAGTEANPVQPLFTWLGINAARVVQAVQVVNELLGQASGEPDQTVALANTPVLPESLTLEMQQNDDSWRAWRMVDDLLTADLDEEVFTRDPESGEIRFGNGLNGKRPRQRMRASYEYGGGPQGNLAVGEIKSSPDVRLQGGFKIENPVPTSGGDNGETTEEGERSIPLYLRHRDRLVTEQDFVDVTWRTPGVDMGRVEVIPLFYPDDESQTVPGTVTLMVIPAGDPKNPLWPEPDRLFLRRVCDHIDSRRLVTTEIYVRGPEYIDINLSLGIQVREGYYRDEVIEAVQERLKSYLSALPPGGPDETGWPRQRKLLKKELEAVAARVAGVDYVDSMYMGIGADYNKEEYDQISGLKLPRLATIQVVAGEAEELKNILGEPPEGPPEDTVVVPIPVSGDVC